METYDPDVAPDPGEWNDLDEDDRMMLISDYHRRAGIQIGEGAQAHITLHLAVENQVAMGEDYVAADALERVMRDAPSRHDAIHALCSVLAEYMWSGARGANVSAKTYERNLKNLTWVRFLRSLDE
jgi:hypothetical protein